MSQKVQVLEISDDGGVSMATSALQFLVGFAYQRLRV